VLVVCFVDRLVSDSTFIVLDTDGPEDGLMKRPKHVV
jgi:hypothetical protein